MTNENINEFHLTDPHDPLRRETVDAMLTAHALEQLEGDERAFAERLLADPARQEDRQKVDEIRQVASILRAGRHDEDVPRSSAIRRAVVAAMSAGRNTAGAQEATQPVVVVAQRTVGRSAGRRLALAGSLVAAVLVVMAAALTLPWALQPRMGREVAQRATPRLNASSVPTDAAAPSLREGLAAGKAAAEGVERSELKRRAVVLSDERGGVPAVRAPSAPPGLAARKEAGDSMESDSFAARNSAALSAAAPAPVGRPAGRDMATDRVEGRFQQANRELGLPYEQQGGERYDQLVENRVLSASEQPLSTFSIDVDTASYANVRRFITSGRLPPPAAVRIEEMVNYFRYDYPQPDGDRPFAVSVEAAECPWNAGRRLVRIGLQGRDIDRRERPAGNLVFLIDVSGSMGDANKLPLVKQALAMLVEELTENDSVAIVTYAGDAGLKLPATSGDQKQKILAAIESLASGGSTHGSAGINLAYEQAAERFIAGGVNRVILATDGDLNVGVTSDEALVDLIRRKAAGGTFLTVLGFGEGNLQDSKMEKIADNGNGVYAYIDGAREARKVLVEQLTGSTITIAKDVKIQVEFNPSQVASYRLLGYENRAMAAQDFRNDRKDAGEIGAGHSVTAIYEITLVGDGADGGGGAEPLKYQPSQPKPAPVAAAAPLVDAETSRELLTVKLRWKRPDGDTSVLDEVPLVERGGAFERASADLRFASAVAAFGMVLRNSDSRGEATLPMVAKIAGGALGADRGGYRAELLDLVRKAEVLRDGGR